MVRKPYIDGKGLKRGAWSEEEDNKLTQYILRYKAWNWNHIPRFAGLARCGKSCRMRWENYLKPGVKRGGFSKDDEQLIFKLQKQHGNKWSLIARKMPGRTDNEIKNYWHTILSKRTSSSVQQHEEDDSSVMLLETSTSSSSSSVVVVDATNNTYVDNDNVILIASTTTTTTDEENEFLFPEESFSNKKSTEPFSMENLICRGSDMSSSAAASTDFNFPSTSFCSSDSGIMESYIQWSPLDDEEAATSSSAAFSMKNDVAEVSPFQTSTLIKRLDSLESFGFWEALWNFLK